VRIIEQFAADSASSSSSAAPTLYLHLTWQSVHSPVEAPAAYVEPYKKVFSDPIRQVHAGMLAVLDEAVGNVSRALQAAGLWNQSLSIVSTDNGGPSGVLCGDCNGALNWPLRGGKHSLFEGGVRGTGFLWSELLFGPGQGRSFSGAMHLTDWLPSILSWLQLPQPSPAPGFELHGYDMSSALLAAAQQGSSSASPRNVTIISINPTCNGTAGIRAGPWKLLLGDPGPPYGWDNSTEVAAAAGGGGPGGSDFGGAPGPMATCADGSPTPPVVRLWPLLNASAAMLFNVESDPREMSNVAAQFPEVVAELRALLEPWGAGKQIWPSQNATQDPRGAAKLHNGSWLPWLP
jgi:arylsulfatase B